MAGLLYPAGGFWTFMLISVAIAGLAGFQTGRAVASGWRPVWQLFVYALLLGAASRFLHFALYQEELSSFRYFAVDALIALAAAFLGWRLFRAGQMTTQYKWLYNPAGPLGWTRK